MADLLKEFARRARKEMCEDPEERKEILALIPIKERLESVPLEQRLEGVPLEKLQALLAKLQREQPES